MKSHLPLLLALLLAHGTGTSLAQAESPLTDPIAPAVIGRPLDQIRPERPRPAPVAKQPGAKPAPARKVVRQQAPRPAVAVQKAAVPPAAALAAGPTAALGAGPAAGPAGSGASVDRPVERVAKQALDDRADPRTRLDEVGKGAHYARKPLGPGAYFDDKDRAAVRKYYAAHPLPGQAARWQIGHPVPPGGAIAPVPQDLRSSLPRLPPGHRYARVDGEVVLIAAGSGMVVDGISRAAP